MRATEYLDKAPGKNNQPPFETCIDTSPDRSRERFALLDNVHGEHPGSPGACVTSVVNATGRNLEDLTRLEGYRRTWDELIVDAKASSDKPEPCRHCGPANTAQMFIASPMFMCRLTFEFSGWQSAGTKGWAAPSQARIDYA